jgi:hypothetical protein
MTNLTPYLTDREYTGLKVHSRIPAETRDRGSECCWVISKGRFSACEKIKICSMMEEREDEHNDHQGALDSASRFDM